MTIKRTRRAEWSSLLELNRFRPIRYKISETTT
jgi:hypothetical protein